MMSVLPKAALDALATAAASNPNGLLMLAERAFSQQDVQRGYQLVQDALALAPADPECAATARDLITRAVPDWHVRIVRDNSRNAAFANAIACAVRPGHRVLDIGAGSGLLAMMAARAGAASVHSCELNPVMASIAQTIVTANGYADRVTLHSSHSQALDPDTDLGGRADVILSEIISDDLVGEEVLPSLRDAASRLAAPGAQFIPRGGEIRVALATMADLHQRQVDMVEGFDLSPLNALGKGKFSVAVGDPALELRGEATTLFAFDFTTRHAPPDMASIDLIATGGEINGVIQWFRLHMDAEAIFDTAPAPGAKSSWACNFFPFDRPMDAVPGTTISVTASVKGDRLRLWRS